MILFISFGSIKNPKNFQNKGFGFSSKIVTDEQIRKKELLLINLLKFKSYILYIRVYIRLNLRLVRR